jgi:c(7)-type cytochrome triheme protein
MFKTSIVIIAVCMVLFGAVVANTDLFKLPDLQPFYQYGNVLIDRTSSLNNVPSVSFSHWNHRLRYTCRVCHIELGFQMAVNATEITEEMNRDGEYCGFCHNGKDSFGHTRKHCKRCHNGDISYSNRHFKRLSRLPRSEYGNKIDWTLALKRRMIRPKRSILDPEYEPIKFDKLLELSADWSMAPMSIFPHKDHNTWLECENCHPDIFNIKKKSTEHLSMAQIIKGKFCGVCHLSIAFPMQDCRRCHPTVKKSFSN